MINESQSILFSEITRSEMDREKKVEKIKDSSRASVGKGQAKRQHTHTFK
jgi:hypothetical protein